MKHVNYTLDYFKVNTSIGTLNVVARTKEKRLCEVSWIFDFKYHYVPEGEDSVVRHATHNTVPVKVTEIDHLIQYFRETIKKYRRINGDDELTFQDGVDLDMLDLKLKEIRDNVPVDNRCSSI